MRAERSPPLIVADCVSVCRTPTAGRRLQRDRRCALRRAESGRRRESARRKELYAPELISDELVSVAVRKARHGLQDVVKQGLDDFAELELTRCRTDVRAQWRLALQYELSAYDAAYLWLAAELGAPLATFDERLGDAARRLLSGS